jgi:cell division protein FtsL
MFVGGLLLTLFLNTFTEQAAFQKHELQVEITQTTALRQRLEAEVARTESPENLLVIAKKMGMVPAAAPVFLRLSDHVILGKPIPAAG